MQKKLAQSLLKIAALTTLLGGCSAATSSSCSVPLVTYSEAFQAQAAKEFRAAGPNVQQLVTDYGKTRDAIREVCRP
jgi:ABC-type glycerol-3-phosphate transport system substrate-binding protein